MIENINRPDEPQSNIASKFLTRFDEEGFFTFQTFADCKTNNTLVTAQRRPKLSALSTDF